MKILLGDFDAEAGIENIFSYQQLGMGVYMNSVMIMTIKQDAGCMDWIHLAQDIDQCWALLSTVMNFQVLQNAGTYLSS
jgi:hypothetical protein